MIKYISPTVKKTFWSKLPSWAWILIGLAALALTLAIIIGGFVALATVEGFASIIFLIVGFVCFGVFSGRQATWPPFLRAIGIGFFALMGATVDQTGNTLYNKPVAACLCPPATALQRSSVTTNPLPGTTEITQDFICFDKDKPVKAINPFAVAGIRFIEYVMLGYLLLALRWLFWRWKSKQANNFTSRLYS